LFKTVDQNNHNTEDSEETISPFIVKRHSNVTISLNDEKILFSGKGDIINNADVAKNRPHSELDL
jgi:hypothetical protein